MELIQSEFDLDECIDWILNNKFKRVVVQLNATQIKYSVQIADYIQQNGLKKAQNIVDCEPFEIYITKSHTCCVDLIVTQHVSNLDAVIHFGKVCLSKPVIKNRDNELPIMFVFDNKPVQEDKFPDIIRLLVDKIDEIKHANDESHFCVLYDVNNIACANQLQEYFTSKYPDKNLIEFANLFSPSDSWYTSQRFSHRLIKSSTKYGHQFGQYLLKHPPGYYTHAIYIGERPSINTCLSFPGCLLILKIETNLSIEAINKSKILNRRIALIERLKDEEELKIGVIITNPLPDIASTIERLESYSKSRKHTLYFITMIQTIDECKIGNFDLCDAFLVINSCTCSSILESLTFNRPILSELEFKLACGFGVEYGGVKWPGTSQHLSEGDLLNRRRVSDVTMALIHTRNELLERCSQARANKWSGLSYGKALIGSDGDDHEDLTVGKGLKGIASSYASEPLKKVDSVELENIPSSCCSTSGNIACDSERKRTSRE